MISAEEALERLRRGNHDFVTVRQHEQDITPQRVQELFEFGQQPFAIVLTCADSRVVPEHMFMTGLGELFVIRVAGNVVSDIELASAVYACEHLHVRLLLVLGHTHCGAIESTIAGGDHGSVSVITDMIKKAIGDETDPYQASVLNARAAIAALEANEELMKIAHHDGLEIKAAIYHTNSGRVDFLD